MKDVTKSSTFRLKMEIPIKQCCEMIQSTTCHMSQCSPVERASKEKETAEAELHNTHDSRQKYQNPDS